MFSYGICTKVRDIILKGINYFGTFDSSKQMILSYIQERYSCIIYMPTLLTNKKAKFDYTIIESFQAGLALPSYMVKLLRGKKINLDGTYIIMQHGALVLLDFGNEQARENIPLLLTRKEVDYISAQLKTKGISCIPLTIKSVGRWLKADIALVKGKKTRDKRTAIKNRDLDRDIGRSLSEM